MGNRGVGGVSHAFLFFVVALATEPALARDPVPLPRIHRDGMVISQWYQPGNDAELQALYQRVAQVGVTHLVFPVHGCQADIHATVVGDCPTWPLAEPLHRAQLAAEAGFSVALLPIVGTPTGDWRGFFDPVDVPAWFASYGAWMEKVALASREVGAIELVVGTEFSKLYKQEAHWAALADRLRPFFPGPLILTVNHDDFKHGFWGAYDAIGVSAYFHLTNDKDPSQETLDAAWGKIRDGLLATSALYQRPLHFTEVGYPSAKTAAAGPWHTGPESEVDAQLQARCFSAFARTWADQPELARFNVWDAAGEWNGLVNFETLGTLSEPILRKLYAARAHLGAKSE
jgi:hypothetical protein